MCVAPAKCISSLVLTSLASSHSLHRQTRPEPKVMFHLVNYDINKTFNAVHIPSSTSIIQHLVQQSAAAADPSGRAV